MPKCRLNSLFFLCFSLTALCFSSSAKGIALRDIPYACVKGLVSLFGKSNSPLREEAASPTSSRVSREVSPQTFDELIQAFFLGLNPDLNQPDQVLAFNIYRRARLGDPNTQIPGDLLNRVAKFLRENPDLEKKPLSDVEIISDYVEYERTEALDKFVTQMTEGADGIRARLFEPEYNKQFWRRLGYEGDNGKVYLLSESEVDRLFSPEFVKRIRDPETKLRDRYQLLFAKLAEIRSKKLQEGHNVEALSKVMADLVHHIGLHDPLVRQKLRSENGRVVLDAIQKINQEREGLAESLGFEHGYGGLLKELGIEYEKGSRASDPEKSGLKEIEIEVLAKPKRGTQRKQTKVVRHLTLVESVLRSCLGGSDCSSRTYPMRALDPNYHYFTLSDPRTGQSSGQVTVVLGTATGPDGPVKVAFVDKIQNVANADIPHMMEGIRRSLKKEGYELSIPTDLGDHNGLSNVDTTSSFIKTWGRYKKQNKVYKKFQPHDHPYNIPEETNFSRAREKLDVKPLLPLKQEESTEFKTQEPRQPTHLKDLDLKKVIAQTVDLKNSDQLEDKIRYIQVIPSIHESGQTADPEYHNTLAKWLKDPDQPIRLKNRILTRYLEGGKHEKLLAFLPYLKDHEQANLIQNWLQADRHVAVIREQLAEDLLFFARAHRPTMKTLSSYLSESTLAQNILRYADSKDPKLRRWVEDLANDPKPERPFIAKLAAELVTIVKEKKDLTKAFDELFQDEKAAEDTKILTLTTLYLADPSVAYRYTKYLNRSQLEKVGENFLRRRYDLECNPVQACIPLFVTNRKLARAKFNTANKENQQAMAGYLSQNPDWAQHKSTVELVREMLHVSKKTPEISIEIYKNLTPMETTAQRPIRPDLFDYWKGALDANERLRVLKNIRDWKSADAPRAIEALLSQADFAVAKAIEKEALPKLREHHAEAAQNIEQELKNRLFSRAQDSNPIPVQHNLLKIGESGPQIAHIKAGKAPPYIQWYEGGRPTKKVTLPRGNDRWIKMGLEGIVIAETYEGIFFYFDGKLVGKYNGNSTETLPNGDIWARNTQTHQSVIFKVIKTGDTVRLKTRQKIKLVRKPFLWGLRSLFGRMDRPEYATEVTSSNDGTVGIYLNGTLTLYPENGKPIKVPNFSEHAKLTSLRKLKDGSYLLLAEKKGEDNWGKVYQISSNGQKVEASDNAFFLRSGVRLLSDGKTWIGITAPPGEEEPTLHWYRDGKKVAQGETPDLKRGEELLDERAITLNDGTVLVPTSKKGFVWYRDGKIIGTNVYGDPEKSPHLYMNSWSTFNLNPFILNDGKTVLIAEGRDLVWWREGKVLRRMVTTVDYHSIQLAPDGSVLLIGSNTLQKVSMPKKLSELSDK